MIKNKILFDEWHGTGGGEDLKQLLSRSYAVETTEDPLTYEYGRRFDVIFVYGQIKNPFITEDHEALHGCVKDGSRLLISWHPKTIGDCINFDNMTHDGGYGLEDLLGRRIRYATDFIPYSYSDEITFDGFLSKRKIRFENIRIPLSAISHRPKLKIYDPNYIERKYGLDESKFPYKPKIELGPDMRAWTMDERTDASLASTGMAWFENPDELHNIRTGLNKKEIEESIILRRAIDYSALDLGFMQNIHQLSRDNLQSLRYLMAQHIEFFTRDICVYFKPKDYNGFSVGICADLFSGISEKLEIGDELNKKFFLRLIKRIIEGSEMSSKYPVVKAKTGNAAEVNRGAKGKNEGVEKQADQSEKYFIPSTWL